MDSIDLEREKGITILAKNTAVRYGGTSKINIVDTPGHADFGGEVERGLTMVDGVLLLVDASEGPLPQTRFVLRKALEARLPVILVINKVDRPDARIDEVSTRSTSCSSTSTPTRTRSSSRSSTATPAPAGASLDAAPSDGPATDLQPLFELLLEHDPAPRLRGRPPAAGARHQPRRVALRRPPRAVPHPPRHDHARASRWRGAAPTARSSRSSITELYVTEALDRVDADEAGPGEIIAVAGLADVTIGETLADPDDPRPLPVIHVDEPSLSMTIGINTSPLAGQERHEAHRPPGQGPPRRRAGRQRVAPRAAHRAARRLGGAGPRRAAARGAGRDHAPRGLRAHGRQAAGRHPEVNGKLHEPVERVDDRRARGLPRRRHPAARAAQGPHGADGQPRHRLGAHGVPRAGARPDRLPHRVHDRDPRHGPCCTTCSTATSRGTASCAPARPAASSPTAAAPTTAFALFNLQERGALFVGARRRGLRGHDRRRELARRRHGRQPHQGEEAHQHARRRRRRAGAADPRRGRCRSSRRSSSSPTTSASRSRPTPCGCAR